MVTWMMTEASNYVDVVGEEEQEGKKSEHLGHIFPYGNEKGKKQEEKCEFKFIAYSWHSYFRLIF